MPQNTQHPQYAAQLPRWQRCRDAYEGKDAIDKSSTKYLPMLTGQLDDSYKAYRDRALFFGATERTTQGLTGAAVSKPFTIKYSEGLKYLEDDCTLTSLRMDELIKWLVGQLLIPGRAGLLVDRDANIAEKPPYIVPYTAEQIINWEEKDGKLQWVMLQECYFEAKPEDRYVLEEKTRFRELFLDPATKKYNVSVHTKKPTGEGYDTTTTQPVRRGEPFDFIPFVIVNANGIGASPCKPPLLALVDVNLSHYRNSADLEHGRHFVGLPTPWITGWVPPVADGTGGEAKPMMIGSAAAWCFPDKDTKVGFLEFTGQGLTTLEKALEQKEKMMAVLGARLLEGQKAGVEATETVRLRQMGDVFTLAGINSSAADAIELVMSYCAIWQGGSGDKGEVTPNNDFADTTLGPQDLTALVGALNAKAISLETFLWNLKRGEMIMGTIEEEQQRIEDAKEAEPAGLPDLSDEEREALGLPPKAPVPDRKEPPVKAKEPVK